MLSLYRKVFIYLLPLVKYLYTVPGVFSVANDCESNPCVNGVCTDILTAFSCTCTDGYGGPTCDVLSTDTGQYECLKISYQLQFWLIWPLTKISPTGFRFFLASCQSFQQTSTVINGIISQETYFQTLAVGCRKISSVAASHRSWRWLRQQIIAVIASIKRALTDKRLMTTEVRWQSCYANVHSRAAKDPADPKPDLLTTRIQNSISGSLYELCTTTFSTNVWEFKIVL